MSKNYAIYAHMKMVYQRHTVLKDHLANQPPGRPGMLINLAMQSEKPAPSQEQNNIAPLDPTC